MRIIDKEFIDGLRERIEKDPSSILFAKLGDLLRQDGNFEEAVNVLKNGLKYHPDYPTAHYILAKCYNELNWIDDAIFELKETLKYDKENISAMEIFASLLYKKGEYEKALKLYDELVILNPSKRDVFEAKSEEIENKLRSKEEKENKNGLSRGTDTGEVSSEESYNETKELDEILEPNKWNDDSSYGMGEDNESSIQGMTGMRELSLDALDVDVSKLTDEKFDTNNQFAKEKGTGDGDQFLESQKQTEGATKTTDTDEEDVPKTFYTITMAQVYINQKQYIKAKKVLDYLEEKDPFDKRVKSLIAKLDNTLKEVTSEKDEKADKSPETIRKEKVLKLNELFETLNKKSREGPKKTDKEENKTLNKKEHPPVEKIDKKEMNKFKNWLKGL